MYQITMSYAYWKAGRHNENVRRQSSRAHSQYSFREFGLIRLTGCFEQTLYSTYFHNNNVVYISLRM